MKSIILLFIYLISVSLLPLPRVKLVTKASASDNLFIIIIDGLRWQEIFNGPDSMLINNEEYTLDPEYTKDMFWSASPVERKRKLMPFFWNVIASKGQLYGNRINGNKFDVANLYAISYPGYNEIFTGTTDFLISGNGKKNNRNPNVLEKLNTETELAGKIAVFSSWDVFPNILNRQRNGIFMNSGYEKMKAINTEVQSQLNAIQDDFISVKSSTRYDMLTFAVAKDYIINYSPKVVVLGLGETDHFAHQKRYDLYLQQANSVDRMIAELWQYVQTTPGYKNKTTFLITTDHGRGSRTKNWSEHGVFIGGSSQTWLGLLGPKITPNGEINDTQQHFSKHLAEAIANLLGKEFSNNDYSLADTK